MTKTLSYPEIRDFKPSLSPAAGYPTNSIAIRSHRDTELDQWLEPIASVQILVMLNIHCENDLFT